jgi:hypothetical protein
MLVGVRATADFFRKQVEAAGKAVQAGGIEPN